MQNLRTHWKLMLAVMAVLLLSAPAAVGVYRALEPTRGSVAAGMAAAGIELVYLSLALLVLAPELRRHARAVALSSVATSIILNVLADYSARVPDGLTSWPQAVARFDPLALSLAILESAPLAGLAFALASLLHRLAEQPAFDASVGTHRIRTQETTPAPAVALWANVPPEDSALQNIAPDLFDDDARAAAGELREPPPAARDYSCKHCGRAELTASELMAHGRKHKRWGSCDGTVAFAAD